MNYALVIAGGSGTRLWPFSTQHNPKQLLPFIGGKSTLEISLERLNGLIEPDNRYVCAGRAYREKVLNQIQSLEAENYIDEPFGMDTLNALVLSTLIIQQHDPDSVIAVFTADHIIHPIEAFQETIKKGLAVIEERPESLLTFGINPTAYDTGCGYLELGENYCQDARYVSRFIEKPDIEHVQKYVDIGEDSYLWNSGMFIWKASTFLECVSRYEPETLKKLNSLLQFRGSKSYNEKIDAVYGSLKRISVDYAIMEPSSVDNKIPVVTVPMSVSWIDVGSWPAYFSFLESDEKENRTDHDETILYNSANCDVASNNSSHLIALLGCKDLFVLQTETATLVCNKDNYDEIKKIHAIIKAQYGTLTV